MKHSLVVLSLLFSSLSFAGTIGNGITLSNLPTASKSYEVKTLNEGEVSSIKENMIAACKSDKSEAEALVLKMGSKILSASGCSVSVSGGYFDQAATPYKISTSFEVIFK